MIHLPIELEDVPQAEVERVRRFVKAAGYAERQVDGDDALRLMAWWGLVRAASEKRKASKGD